MSDEWNARRSEALASLRTLGNAEQVRAREAASRSTISAVGPRPKTSCDRGWAFTLSPSQHKALAEWDYKYEYFLVCAIERIAEASRRAPEPAWSEGRE